MDDFASEKLSAFIVSISLSMWSVASGRHTPNRKNELIQESQCNRDVCYWYSFPHVNTGTPDTFSPPLVLETMLVKTVFGTYIYQLPQWRQNDGTLQLAAMNSVEHFPQFVEMLLLCRHNLQHHRLEILLIWIIWWSRPTTKFLTHKTSFTMNTKAEEHYLCEIPQKCHKLR